MPIKGLTDRGLAFPEIGQIRKGAKKEGNRPGAELTYFRVEFDEQEKKAEASFREVYKDKPAFIRIIFPFNEIERMWDAWYEAYTAGRMVARSDGERIVYQLDDQGEIIVKNGVDMNGNPVLHPADSIAGRDYKGNPIKFKATGRLKIIIPELSRAAYLTVMTTSIHDIVNISAQLAAFKELNNGQLAGIPFLLRRRPKAISTPSGENGQRARRVKWLISIEADPEWVKAKLSQVRALAMPNMDESLLLPSGDVEQGDIVEADEDENEEFAVPTVDEPVQDVELIKPHGDWAVTEAAKLWNVDNSTAAKEIWKRIASDKPMDKRDFMQIIHGEPESK